MSKITFVLRRQLKPVQFSTAGSVSSIVNPKILRIYAVHRHNVKVRTYPDPV